MSFQQIRPSGFSFVPPVVKNLLIINGLFFVGTWAFARYGIDLVELLGLHLPQSQLFRPHQLITYLFMHANFRHILFNMFALWMFGTSLENYWGAKRFLIYFMITGLGAGLIQLCVQEWQLFSIAGQLASDQIDLIRSEGAGLLSNNKNYSNLLMRHYNLVLNSTTIGASGAVFGLLLAFGMTFPNARIYLYFLLPIKAKYFVILYGLFELYSGVSNNAGDNVAHFAHLGGMIFGFGLIKYWQKNRFRYN